MIKTKISGQIMVYYKVKTMYQRSILQEIAVETIEQTITHRTFSDRNTFARNMAFRDSIQKHE